MKTLITVLSLLTFTTTAYAAETVGEKASAKVNDAKRTVKQKAHRLDEKVCDKSDKECLKEKASHRATEAKDYVGDKATEGKNIIDNKKE